MNCRQRVDYADQHYHREDMPHVAAYFTCDKPAPPEPAESVDTTKTVAYCDELDARYGKPAAREMESARGAIAAAREYALELDHPESMEFHIRVDGFATGARYQRNLAQPVAVGMTEELADLLDSIMAFADADPDTPVKQIWRKKVSAVREQAAQPVAVGMTEELEHVLSIAERDLRYKEECFDDSARTVPDERIERLRAAIAAVRQQAGNGRKVECPNCGEMTERSHSRYEGPGPDKWACQPAPPEPAAPEMPEAVKNAWKALRKENYETFALALESWWRTHSAPRVGMTEELRMILDVAESRAEDQRHDGLLECSRNLERAIAAVRQQAAQGRKVELGKARKMLEYMRRCAWHEETYQQIEEALAELDAAEKGEGRG